MRSNSLSRGRGKKLVPRSLQKRVPMTSVQTLHEVYILPKSRRTGAVEALKEGGSSSKPRSADSVDRQSLLRNQEQPRNSAHPLTEVSEPGVEMNRKTGPVRSSSPVFEGRDDMPSSGVAAAVDTPDSLHSIVSPVKGRKGKLTRCRRSSAADAASGGDADKCFTERRYEDVASWVANTRRVFAPNLSRRGCKTQLLVSTSEFDGDEGGIRKTGDGEAEVIEIPSSPDIPKRRGIIESGSHCSDQDDIEDSDEDPMQLDDDAAKSIPESDISRTLSESDLHGQLDFFAALAVPFRHALKKGIFSTGEDETYATVHSGGHGAAITLTGFHIRRTYQAKWVTDEVMNGGVYMINRRFGFKGHPKKEGEVLMTHSFFYGVLTGGAKRSKKAGISAADISSGYERVKSWFQTTEFSRLHHLFVPIHVEGLHWVLCHFDLWTGKCYFIDSLSKAPCVEKKNEFLLNLKQWLYRALIEECGVYDVVTQKVENMKMIETGSSFPQQSDGNSCGIFVLCTVLKLASGFAVDYCQEDIPMLRYRWVQAFQRGSLEGMTFMKFM